MLIKNNLFSIFTKYFLSYVLFIIIIISVSVVGYLQNVMTAQNSYIDREVNNLKQGQQLLDIRLDEIENIFYLLNQSPEIIKTQQLKHPLKDSDYIDLIDANDIISRLTITNNFFSDLYIYYNKINVLLSNRYVVTDIELFYNNFITNENISYEKWSKELFENYYNAQFIPSRNITDIHQKSTQSKVLLINSIDNNTLSRPYDTFFVLIDNNAILETLGHNLDSESYMYVFDTINNTIIVSSTPKNKEELNNTNIGIDNISTHDLIKIDGIKYLRIYSKSSQNDIACLKFIPFKNVISNTWPSRIFMLAVIFISLVSSMILAYIFAKKNTNPINDLTNQVSTFMHNSIKRNQGEFDYLKNNMLLLFNERDTMINDLKLQSLQMKISFIDNLIKGTYSHLTSDNKFHNDIIKELGYGKYFVIIANLGDDFITNQTDYREIDILIAMCIRQLNEKIPYKTLFHRVSVSSINIIVSVNNINRYIYKERINSAIYIVADYFLKNHSIKLFSSIGTECDKLLNISQSYYEANQARISIISDNKPVVSWYEDIPKWQVNLYYPLEIEMKIVNYAKAGMKQECINLIEQIYNNNITSNNIHRSEAEQLLYEFRGTCIKLIKELYINNDIERQAVIKDIKDIKDISKANSLNDLYNMTMNIFNTICDYADEKVKYRKNIIINNIEIYIEQNYNNNEICLSSIALEFHLTEKYLSSLYSEIKRISISEYIEEKRLNKAMQILDSEQMPIKQVAQMVGYTTYNTFYKAFKRKFGIGPGDFKNKIK